MFSYCLERQQHLKSILVYAVNIQVFFFDPLYSDFDIDLIEAFKLYHHRTEPGMRWTHHVSPLMQDDNGWTRTINIELHSVIDI